MGQGMTVPHPLSSAPRPLLMLLVFVVIAWSSKPALASNMGDCSSICHRTGMLGRFAGCRCSLTLFSKRAAYGSDAPSPDLMRPKHAIEAGEEVPMEDGVAEDSIFPIEDSGFFLFPKTDLLMPSEQNQLQYYQPLLTASKVAHLLALKRNNMEQHQQLVQQQRLRQQQLQQQQLQKQLQLRVAESHRVTRGNTVEEEEM